MVKPAIVQTKRILLLTTSVGSGHKRAGEAIQEALSERCPKFFNIQTETYFDYFPPLTKEIVSGTYVKTIQLMRWVLKYLYKYQKKDLDRKSAKHFFSKPLIKKYEKSIKNFEPDVIVCTQALSCKFVSILKANGKFFAPLIAVITDFDIHPYWLNKYVDKFVVPTHEIKEEFIRHGIEADKIHSFGIPIHPHFSKTQNKLVLKRKLGIIKDLPAVLIMGGGWGLGPIKKIVLHLNTLEMAFQLIVVTGENGALKKKLDRILFKLKVPVKIYGYVNNMNELMDVSEIAITKPGGLTVSELLAKGLPSVLVDVIPGQEDANGEYLISNGAAYRIKKISQLKDMIQALLRNPEKLNQMKMKARTAARPSAAADTAGLIMNTISGKL